MLTLAVKMMFVCVVVVVVVGVDVVLDADPADAWQPRLVEEAVNWIDGRIEGLDGVVLQSFDERRTDRATLCGNFEDGVERVVLEALKNALLDDAGIAPPRLVRLAEGCCRVFDVVEGVQRGASVKHQFVIDQGDVYAGAVVHAAKKMDLHAM